MFYDHDRFYEPIEVKCPHCETLAAIPVSQRMVTCEQCGYEWEEK